MAYSVARLVLAWSTLADYGLNVWVFGALDLATTYPYAIGTSRLVFAAVERDSRQAAFWSGVTVLSFSVPYVYAAVTINRLPADLADALLQLVGVLLLASVIGVLWRVRVARRQWASTDAIVAD